MRNAFKLLCTNKRQSFFFLQVRLYSFHWWPFLERAYYSWSIERDCVRLSFLSPLTLLRVRPVVTDVYPDSLVIFNEYQNWASHSQRAFYYSDHCPIYLSLSGPIWYLTKEMSLLVLLPCLILLSFPSYAICQLLLNVVQIKVHFTHMDPRGFRVLLLAI